MEQYNSEWYWLMHMCDSLAAIGTVCIFTNGDDSIIHRVSARAAVYCGTGGNANNKGMGGIDPLVRQRFLRGACA